MATAPHPVTEVAEVKTRKPRDPNKPRKTPVAREIFGLVQVLGEDGQPIKVERAKVKLISFEKNPMEVLRKIEGGDYPNAVYLMGTLPPGR